ncbi:MAG: hypothetical protein HZA51_12005, partial [Planctomycetes bacterium]|nr:hypothetical protein [Planctomycetota bacterium]
MVQLPPALLQAVLVMTEHDVPTQHRPVVVSQGLLVQFPPLTHDPEQFDCVVTEHDV